MKLLSLERSDRPEKKYMVVIETDSGRKKTIHFGDSSLKDYTLFNAQEREAHKRSYLARHGAREDWEDPLSAGFWSRWLLWGPHPSVSANLKFIRHKYHL